MAFDANEPAFPNPTFNGQSQGLSKREYFAAMMMQSLMTDSERIYEKADSPARDAVELADALIAELAKKTP